MHVEVWGTFSLLSSDKLWSAQAPRTPAPSFLVLLASPSGGPCLAPCPVLCVAALSALCLLSSPSHPPFLAVSGTLNVLNKHLPNMRMFLVLCQVLRTLKERNGPYHSGAAPGGPWGRGQVLDAVFALRRVVSCLPCRVWLLWGL